MTDILRFGPFRLDPADETLWLGSDRVPLRPKSFAVLLYLAQHAGRLVTKDELLSNVWRGITVNEELLRGYIRELRRLLGDDPHSPKLIETVPRRGYRFLPQVTSEVDTSSADPSAERTTPSRASPITVGVLHSLTGMMAWTESPVVDATL